MGTPGVKPNDARPTMALAAPSTALHEMIEQQVDRTPDATAVVFQGDRLTYRELDERANQLARRLITLGAGPRAIVRREEHPVSSRGETLGQLEALPLRPTANEAIFGKAAAAKPIEKHENPRAIKTRARDYV